MPWGWLRSLPAQTGQQFLLPVPVPPCAPAQRFPKSCSEGSRRAARQDFLLPNRLLSPQHISIARFCLFGFLATPPAAAVLTARLMATRGASPCPWMLLLPQETPGDTQPPRGPWRCQDWPCSESHLCLLLGVRDRGHTGLHHCCHTTWAAPCPSWSCFLQQTHRAVGLVWAWFCFGLFFPLLIWYFNRGKKSRCLSKHY